MPMERRGNGRRKGKKEEDDRRNGSEGKEEKVDGTVSSVNVEKGLKKRREGKGRKRKKTENGKGRKKERKPEK